MPVVSTRVERYRQANGSIHVVERHTDDAGVEHMRLWLADQKADIDAKVAEHIIDLEAELQERVATEKEAQDARSLDEKLLTYAKEQPVEVLKTDVKLTDDEIAVLAKREAPAIKEADSIIRG